MSILSEPDVPVIILFPVGLILKNPLLSVTVNPLSLISLIKSEMTVLELTVRLVPSEKLSVPPDVIPKSAKVQEVSTVTCEVVPF